MKQAAIEYQRSAKKATKMQDTTIGRFGDHLRDGMDPDRASDLTMEAQTKAEAEWDDLQSTFDSFDRGECYSLAASEMTGRSVEVRLREPSSKTAAGTFSHTGAGRQYRSRSLC